MRIKITMLVMVGALLACNWHLSVNAAPITRSFTFEASGFGSDSPYNSVSGAFTLTFDPFVTDQVLSVDAFTSTLPSTYSPVKALVESNFPPGVHSPDIFIGNDCTGSCFKAAPGKDDFIFGFKVDEDGQVYFLGSTFFLTSTLTPSLPAFEGVFTVANATALPAPVPLPASAPMFGAALLALGAVGYGVKRKKAAAAA